MNNLNNLIEKIMIDGEIEANEIIEKAKQERTTIMEEKRQKAKEKVEAIIDQAKRQANDIKEQAISSAHIKARDTKLTAKGQLIDNVLKMTQERLNNLDDETYIKFLQNRLEQIDLKGTEIIIVPKSKRQIVENLNLTIKVADNKSVESGFHLVDDQIIMNYTFSSILTFYEDELRLLIARILFNENE